MLVFIAPDLPLSNKQMPESKVNLNFPIVDWYTNQCLLWTGHHESDSLQAYNCSCVHRDSKFLSSSVMHVALFEVTREHKNVLGSQEFTT